MSMLNSVYSCITYELLYYHLYYDCKPTVAHAACPNFMSYGLQQSLT